MDDLDSKIPPQSYVDLTRIAIPVVLFFGIVLGVAGLFYQIGGNWQRLEDKLHVIEVEIHDIRCAINKDSCANEIRPKVP